MGDGDEGKKGDGINDGKKKKKKRAIINEREAKEGRRGNRGINLGDKGGKKAKGEDCK